MDARFLTDEHVHAGFAAGRNRDGPGQGGHAVAVVVLIRVRSAADDHARVGEVAPFAQEAVQAGLRGAHGQAGGDEGPALMVAVFRAVEKERTELGVGFGLDLADGIHGDLGQDDLGAEGHGIGLGRRGRVADAQKPGLHGLVRQDKGGQLGVDVAAPHAEHAVAQAEGDVMGGGLVPEGDVGRGENFARGRVLQIEDLAGSLHAHGVRGKGGQGVLLGIAHEGGQSPVVGGQQPIAQLVGHEVGPAARGLPAQVQFLAVVGEAEGFADGGPEHVFQGGLRDVAGRPGWDRWMGDGRSGQMEQLLDQARAVLGRGGVSVQEEEFGGLAGFEAYGQAQAGDGIEGVAQVTVVQGAGRTKKSLGIVQGGVADEVAPIVLVADQADMGLVGGNVRGVHVDLRRRPQILGLGRVGLDDAVAAEDGPEFGHEPGRDVLPVVERMAQLRIGVVQADFPI